MTTLFQQIRVRAAGIEFRSRGKDNMRGDARAGTPLDIPFLSHGAKRASTLSVKIELCVFFFGRGRRSDGQGYRARKRLTAKVGMAVG